jgi:hypothetical protein
MVIRDSHYMRLDFSSLENQYSFAIIAIIAFFEIIKITKTAETTKIIDIIQEERKDFVVKYWN